MIGGVLKRLRWWLVPEAPLLAAVVALTHWAPPDTLEGLAQFYPYAVLAAGALLGWRFHRSRLLFGLLILALAHAALPPLPPLPTGRAPTAAGARLVFQAAAFLLPLNLAALGLMAERGFLSLVGLVRLGTILLQTALVYLLPRLAPRPALRLLEQRVLPESLLGWTPIEQPALLAFGAALALLAASLLMQASPASKAVFWALLAAFLGLNGGHASPTATMYFATAGLILVVAVIEASFHMAYLDGLTGLPARRALNEALLRLGGQYTVAMVDVDHFKRVNDTYGHDVGDQVLRMVATHLAQAPGGGEAFRYGGEEFAVLFAGRSVSECLPHLEDLRQVVEQSPFTRRGRIRLPARRGVKPPASRKPSRRISITVSVGAAEKDDRHATPDQVIQAADRALYKAKEGGRNRVEI